MSLSTPPVVSNSEFTKTVSNSLLKLLENRGSIRHALRMARVRDIRSFEVLISAIVEDLGVVEDRRKLEVCLTMVINDRDNRSIQQYMIPQAPRR
jgi:hypothetical protein